MQLEDVTEGAICRISSFARDEFTPSSSDHVLTKEDAIDFWTRMTQLPHDLPMRCHTPRYGIALGRNGDYHWFATICWNCNNIHITQDGVESGQTFDGESPAARQLLSEVRALLGDNDNGEDV